MQPGKELAGATNSGSYCQCWKPVVPQLPLADDVTQPVCFAPQYYPLYRWVGWNMMAFSSVTFYTMTYCSHSTYENGVIVTYYTPYICRVEYEHAGRQEASVCVTRNRASGNRNTQLVVTSTYTVSNNCRMRLAKHIIYRKTTITIHYTHPPRPHINMTARTHTQKPKLYSHHTVTHR